VHARAVKTLLQTASTANRAEQAIAPPKYWQHHSTRQKNDNTQLRNYGKMRIRNQGLRVMALSV
jgi:hypothetical protein